MYAAALSLTLIIEMPAYAGVLRHGLNIRTRRGLIAGAAVNLVSHPLAFLLAMPALAGPLGFLALVIIEASVWAFESALLWGWVRRDLDLIGLSALLANVASLALGLLLIA